MFNSLLNTLSWFLLLVCLITMQRVHNKAPSATVKHHLIKQSNNGGATAETEMQEPSIETDKLSYEIFSILESKFLFGYDDDPTEFRSLWPDVRCRSAPQSQACCFVARQRPAAVRRPGHLCRSTAIGARVLGQVLTRRRQHPPVTASPLRRFRR